MRVHVLGVLVLVAGLPVLAQVVSSDFDSMPVDEGWSVQQNFCDPDEWVDEGWFFQHVETCPDSDPPVGQQLSYIRSLSNFIGVATFFVEWVMESTGDRSEFLYGAPSTLVAGSNGPTNYNFWMASDQVKFFRDARLPILFFDVEPNLDHTLRLELREGSYKFFIDAWLVDEGIPEGPYPSSNPRIAFRAKKKFVDSTARWNYIRYGTIPEPGSGDFDSDGDLDLRDLYFFDECLANGGPDTEAGPGCLWADLDGDGDVDFEDFGLMQLAFTGGG